MSAPYTDADVEQLAAMVRARIGWPISAGEAGTIVTVVLEELIACGRLRDAKPLPVAKPPRQCRIDSCDGGGPFRLDYCEKHYSRLRRTGDPLGVEGRDYSNPVAAGREVYHQRWERLADPGGTLDPADRAERAASVKSAHYARMAQARWSKAANKASEEVKP